MLTELISDEGKESTVPTDYDIMCKEIRCHLDLALHSLGMDRNKEAELYALEARRLLSHMAHSLEEPDYNAKLNLVTYNSIMAEVKMRAGMDKAAASGNIADVERGGLEAAIIACENGYNIALTLNSGQGNEQMRAILKAHMTRFLDQWATACAVLGTHSYERGNALLKQAKGQFYNSETLEQCTILLGGALKWYRTIAQIGEEAIKQGVALKQGITGHALDIASAITADMNEALRLQGRTEEVYNVFCRN